MSRPTNPSRIGLLRGAYQAALGWKGDDLLVVDYLVAWAVANQVGGRQAKVWGFMVGPSGVGKTEAVFPMYGLPFLYYLNALTDKSLISGLDKDDGRDYSNLPQMNNKLVVMPEFTTIVQMPSQQSNVIMAELRSIYDGLPFRKVYGTGPKEYDVSFGLMACVTPIIDAFLDQHTQLGERFVMFRLMRDFSFRKESELLRQMRKRSHVKEKWRGTLKATMKQTLKFLENPKGMALVPPQSDELQDRVQAAAQLVARSRSVNPPHLSGSMLMDTNAATRMIQQLQNLGAGRMIAEERSQWDDGDWQLVRRVAEDSLSREGYRLLRVLSKTDRPQSSVELGRLTGVSGSRVAQIMAQWQMNEITAQKGKLGWALSDVGQELLETTQFFQTKENTLD